ncbi:MAG: PDZ domain-containing protein [Planctomycetota bacterium]
MARTNRTKTTLAAGLLAVVGLAAPTHAQSTTTTTNISINNGEVEGESIRIVDGTEYTIEFDEDGVHSAFVDGEEVGYSIFAGNVIIKHDGETIEIPIPQTAGQVGGRIFGIGQGDLPRLGLGEGFAEGRDFFVTRNGPKTMVGLSQGGLDDQLRKHLDLDDGVGTMILSVTEGLPADEAGLEVGDVLIAVDGEEVTGSNVLTRALKELEPGDELDVTVLRKGLPETMTIEVAKFDAQKLYGERFFGINAPNAPGGIPQQRILRWGDIDDDRFPFGNFENEFDFEELEDRIRDELADIRELDDEQREALDRAMAEAREQVAAALAQADRARALQFNLRRGNELLLRDRENNRPLLIERDDDIDKIEDMRRSRDEANQRVHELISELRKPEGEVDRDAIIEELAQASREARDLHFLYEPERRFRDSVISGEDAAAALAQRNKELESRLKMMEDRLDRMLELLEKRDEK